MRSASPRARCHDPDDHHPAQQGGGRYAVTFPQPNSTLRPLDPLRIYAVPVAASTPAGPAAIARHASLVGYRLTRAALAPAERYRTEAAAIAAGATTVRLAVPTSDDEIARLGRTLNDMLSALDTAQQRERRFVQDASHELHTPLTVLATKLELSLRRPRTTAELEATVRAAAADTADLIALPDALLAVSSRPATDAATATVDFGDVVASQVDRYRTTANPDAYRPDGAGATRPPAPSVYSRLTSTPRAERPQRRDRWRRAPTEARVRSPAIAAPSASSW